MYVEIYLFTIHSIELKRKLYKDDIREFSPEVLLWGPKKPKCWEKKTPKTGCVGYYWIILAFKTCPRNYRNTYLYQV